MPVVDNEWRRHGCDRQGNGTDEAMPSTTRNGIIINSFIDSTGDSTEEQDAEAERIELKFSCRFFLFFAVLRLALNFVWRNYLTFLHRLSLETNRAKNTSLRYRARHSAVRQPSLRLHFINSVGKYKPHVRHPGPIDDVDDYYVLHFRSHFLPKLFATHTSFWPE